MNFLNPQFSKMAGAASFLAFCIMLFFWLLQLKTRNAGTVDLGWVLGLMSAAGISFFCGQGSVERKSLLFLMVLIWSSRLAFMLLKRVLGGRPEDPRYQDIRAGWGKNADLNFFFFFEFQALLVVILALPFFISSQNGSPLSFFEIAGFLIWLTGFLGEAAADGQLLEFKGRAENKCKPCDAGLWKYSRHPNYFFEWVIWVGYFVYACGSPGGWVSIVCPLLMAHFLVNVSGIPPAEAQALKTKGDLYRSYQKRTSAFIPWRPKPL